MLTGLKEAHRFWKRARRVKRHGFSKLQDSPEHVCRTIIETAYKKHGFFPASLGHFSEFYVRDFSWCAEALVHLGYKNEVRSTLQYALKHFLRADKITTMITPSGEAYDFPAYGPDALALFLLTFQRTGNADLVEKHKQFFQKQADMFVRKVIDRKTWLPKRHAQFTSMRDNAKRQASCYDMTMVCVVAKACEDLGLSFPRKFAELRELLTKTYWNGTYFFSDIQKQDIVTGDANVFPFWTGVIDDKEMLGQAFTAIQAAGLDEGLPLRYVSRQDKKREKVRWHVASWFAPDYETDSIWAHMAPLYIALLSSVDKERARRHVRAYAEKIREHGTFLELYNDKGDPYETPFYVTDEGMLWCAPFLNVAKELNVL